MQRLFELANLLRYLVLKGDPIPITAPEHADWKVTRTHAPGALGVKVIRGQTKVVFGFTPTGFESGIPALHQFNWVSPAGEHKLGFFGNMASMGFMSPSDNSANPAGYLAEYNNGKLALLKLFLRQPYSAVYVFDRTSPKLAGELGRRQLFAGRQELFPDQNSVTIDLALGNIHGLVPVAGLSEALKLADSKLVHFGELTIPTTLNAELEMALLANKCNLEEVMEAFGV